MSRIINPRTYSVRRDRDLHGNGLDWRLSLTGDGHWCIGGFGGRYRSEAKATEAGVLWVATGFPPSEQDRRPQVLAAALVSIARGSFRVDLSTPEMERAA